MSDRFTGHIMDRSEHSRSANDAAPVMYELTEEQERVALLKFQILAEGMTLTKRAQDALFGSDRSGPVKLPIRTRSGVSGGLDLRISSDVFVNAPVLEPYCRDSRTALDWSSDHFELLQDEAAVAIAEPLSEPSFHHLRTEDGAEEMVRVAQMCSPDRLCYGMTGPSCVFWPAHARCKYCSIGLNAPDDARRKTDEHFYEVLKASLREREWPARHVLLGGGTPRGRDMGAAMAARLCRGIKQIADVPVYVMIVAPLDDHFIDELYDAGVDELGLNLEFWSERAWDEYIPGKRDRVGHRRYMEALEHAVKRFGPVRTRSILIAGLEPAESTAAGVRALSEMGVMPILSPFRPLAGTDLQHHRGFSAEEYWKLFESCRHVANQTGIPLGPTCICCQNNTLTLPYGSMYRRYGLPASDA